MMASIGEAIFSKTVGLLVNKARCKMAEKLKDGDVTDQKLRDMVVGEMENIKTKLDGNERKDLLASVDFLEKGTVCLNQVFEKTSVDRTSNGTAAAARVAGNSEEEGSDTTDGSGPQAASLITEGIKSWKLTDPTGELLVDAKKRFEDARRKATEAFNNEALSTSDRILALKIQLMAAILERVDRPADAVEECRLCLKNLHAMPAVQSNFEVHLAGGTKSKLNKEEREAIIVDVCQVNYVVFRVMQDIDDGRGETITLPYLKVGRSESVDVLRDERVVKELLDLDRPELCIGFWSLGQQGTDNTEKVQCPRIVAADARRGQFLVAEKDFDKWIVKVYSHSGKFQYSLQPRPPPAAKTSSVFAVAVDRDDNVYVLARLRHTCTGSGAALMLESAKGEFFVYIFSASQKQKQVPDGSFPLTTMGFQGRKMTVNDNNQVFVAGELINEGRIRECRVEVFDTEGRFRRRFGKNILKHPYDITAANDGRVLVLDREDDDAPPCVHTFSAEGEHLQHFPLKGSSCENGSLAFDRSSEAVFVSLWGAPDGAEDVKVSMYKDSKFVRHLLVNDEDPTGGVAVSVDGRLAVICDGRRVCVGGVKDL